MAQFADFPQSNLVLKPAPGTEARVGELPVFTDGEQCISSWQLTPAEIEEILRTGRVWVYVLGQAHPPIFITGTEPAWQGSTPPAAPSS